MDATLGLYNFSAIQNYQQQGQARGLLLWDERLKITLLLAVSFLNVVLASPRLSFALWLLGLGLIIYSRIPYKLCLFFLLAPAWTALLVILGFAIGFGNDGIIQIGRFIIYRQGLQMALSAACRIGCESIWMAAVFISTPIEKIIKSFKWMRIPDTLLEVLSLTYRYLFLLHAEFQRMTTAARSRGGMDGFSTSLHTWSMIVAQIFLRTYDRSQRVQAAILSRGGE